MSRQKNIRNVTYLGVILILVLVMLFSGLRILEATVLNQGQDQSETYTSKTITRNGIDYFPRQDITVMMVLGIDEFGIVGSSDSYNNSGAADMVMLLIFDHKDETCNALYLNRDTMLEMPILGIGGKQAGTNYGQLALAHTYGTGLEDSCENTRKTVSDFLNGITIDYYVAMNMDAIPILNDAVGGVTVTVVDDFSKVNPSIPMGEVTLQGEQVIDFVRTRKDVGDQKNVTRMERQKEYVDGFLNALYQKEHEGFDFVVDLYDKVAPYIVTDCSVNTLSGMLDRYADYDIREVVSPVGENIIADGHYEFYADEEALDELIVSLFYTPKR